MDRDEAKHILSLCRPGNDEDRKNSVIAEALALLESDAELRAWFENEQAEDARIANAFEAIEPPTDLKASILAGMRAHAANESDEDKVFAFEAPEKKAKTSNRMPIWIGLAACFAVLFGVMATQQNRNQQPGIARADTTITAGAPDVVQFLSERIGSLAGPQDLDMRDPQIAPLQAHLARMGAPTPKTLPGKLNNLPTLGCVAFDYKRCKISMICFKSDGVFHFATVRKKNVSCVTSPEPQFFELNGQAFQIWEEGDQVHIIATQGTKESLPDFI